MKSKQLIMSAAGLALLLVLGALLWGPLQNASADSFTAANKLGISASDQQILNQTQLPNDKQVVTTTLMSTSLKTSTPRDLIISVNADGTFDIDVTITGMGNVDGRAKHGTTRFVDDRPIRICGISPARLLSAGQTQAAE